MATRASFARPMRGQMEERNMRTGTAILFSLAIALTAPSVWAGEGQPKNMAALTGTCRVQLVKGFFPCDPKVAYVEMTNGRSFVMFNVGDRQIAVSGGHDRQPNLENLYLSIDTIRMTRGAVVEAVDNRMEGECHLSFNKTATAFHFVKCDVYNRAKGSMYNLYLENITKTDHQSF
jgi:hypothetical protein